MEQPNPYGQTPIPKPKNWLIESILATIFCCLPLGVVGIVYAAKVNEKYALGDYVGAQAASSNAAIWTKASFFVALAGIILWFLAVFIFGVTAWQLNDYN